MRKYPILLLALALLLGVSAVFAACAMDAPKDQVAFTERVIYGDPAAADGLTVALHEQYRNYLHWASTLSFTESSYTAHTDYTFEHDRYWNNNSGVVRSLNIWDGISASYDFDQDNALAAAVNALEDKVQPGTTASALLRVADYYETYPLDVNIVLTDMFYGTQPAYQLGPEQDAMTRIQDYFQIPVLDDQYLEVEVGKSVNGGSSVGMNSTEQGDSFDFYTQSVATDDAFYFFFSNRTQLGNLVDTSRVPGGYGVYRRPYGWVDTDEPYKGQEDGWHNYDVFADQLECIYAVDPEITLSYLAASGDGTRLFLHTIEGEDYVLYVLDAASGAELQRIVVGPFGPDDWWERTDGPDFQFVRFPNEFFLYALTEDGLLEQALHVKFSDIEQDEEYLPWYSIQNRDFAWQDGRLAIVCNSRADIQDGEQYPSRYHYSLGCGLSVSVYADDALQYYGIYDSTLDLANGYAGDVQPPYQNPISTVWAAE